MGKRILIINGHPDAESFNQALAETYKLGALASGAEVKEIHIHALDFNPNLKFGYNKISPLEADLLKAIEALKWANHLVWIHPVWWGGLPAQMKGFIDRVFLPGTTFKYKKDSIWWDRLLKGRSARIITTMDQPGWYYWLFYGKPSINQLKKSTLEFCGVSPVKVTTIGPIRNADTARRNIFLKKVNALGASCK